MERRLAAVFALDMVGYSRLMEAAETDTLARLDSVRSELIEPAIERRRGRIVKGTGDGLLAEFASAVDAVECATDIQAAMEEWESGEPQEPRIRFRIGINVGDIIVRDGDIYGDGVNVAARIESLAEYVVVAQEEHHVERHRRQETAEWVLWETDRPDDTIALASVGCELPLVEVYDKVDFD